MSLRMQKLILPLVPPAVAALATRLMPISALEAYRKRTNDVAVVSYPCSGRTWLRLMLGAAIHSIDGAAKGNPREAYELHHAAYRNPKVPRIYFTHDGEPYYQAPHKLRIDRREYAGRRIVLLARDPRDTLVSWYHELVRRGFGTSGKKAFDGSLEEFVACEWGSIETIIAFNNMWMAHADLGRSFTLIRYEDLKADTFAALRGLCDAIGLGDVTDACLRDAVAFGDFDNMRRMETDNDLNWSAFRPADRDDPESYKTRKGQVGGYREELPAAAVKKLDALVRETSDPRLGYSSS